MMIHSIILPPQHKHVTPSLYGNCHVKAFNSSHKDLQYIFETNVSVQVGIYNTNVFQIAMFTSKHL